MNANFDRPGDDEVVAFVLKSVEVTFADLSEHRLRNKMDALMREAEHQLFEAQPGRDT